MEYDLKGRKFTCVRDNGKKLSKIDRFLVCPDYFNGSPDAVLRGLSPLHSDHCPLILTSSFKNFGPKPFRVFDSWIENPGYVKVVEKAVLNFSYSGPPDLGLIKKFATIRNSIRKWKDEMVKKEGEDYSRASEEIDIIEKIMEDRGLSESEEWSYIENKKLILEIDRRKNLDMKQRSRTKWALDGDENTKIFHSLVNIRRAVNQIPGLTIDGRWVNNPSKVRKEVMRFFKSRFTEDFHSRPALVCEGFKQLNEVDKLLLVEQFSLNEIRQAVKECGDDKAPGRMD
ncbi:hypothetical protein L1987_36271 [Smallanthus sonchifolius]|uniref:Uncharacterized protein n=1 Tax=Smallanthus sonchifolius TaxID=185202 RepID=A0ACB9HE92_9ASTR|nr:hypothetical protein L1987_36271 [Smallanthus sonchifolius]